MRVKIKEIGGLMKIVWLKDWVLTVFG